MGTDGQRAAGSSVGPSMQVQAKGEEQVQKKERTANLKERAASKYDQLKRNNKEHVGNTC